MTRRLLIVLLSSFLVAGTAAAAPRKPTDPQKKLNPADQKWAGNNTERWCNKTYDDMFAAYKKELDPAKRNDLIIKMNDLLVSDVVLIPLVARSSPFSGASKQLKGIVANPWDSEMWNIADWTK